jgi:hypothetical protein
MQCSVPFAAQAPRKPPKPGEVSDPRQELQAMLRGVADDIDALGEFAVAIDQPKTQVLSASARVHRGRPLSTLDVRMGVQNSTALAAQLGQ